jgi:hypothetical protein
MKIGDFEIPDSAVEDAFKSRGMRIVEGSDYEKKAAAAADLAKFRKVTGDDRSIDDIQAIINEHEAAKKKNQTQAELALAEAVRLGKEKKAVEAELTLMKLEVRKRDVKSYFENAMQVSGIKVIDPILEPYRAQFYDLDESKVTAEQLKEQVVQALTKASELQKGELQRLGLQGVSPDEHGASFGGGMTFTQQETRQSKEVGPLDFYKIMRETSATPLGVPLMRDKGK